MDDAEPSSTPVGVAIVGASAGGVEALKAFAAALPATLGCPVVVILHVSSTGTSVLPQILERAGALPAKAAANGDALLPGHVYVAPPDCHVLVSPGHIRLSGGPRENGHRPAVDPAMRSAAEAYGRRAVGIVLSGTRDDGTAGLAAIQAAGGRILVQDPDEALYAGMPRSALNQLTVDGVHTIAELAHWLTDAAGGDHPEGAKHPDAVADPEGFAGDGPADDGTRFTCPDCGGVLFEMAEAGVVRLQCLIGHAFSPDSLAAEQGRELERALWTATRALDERAVLLERMAGRARRNDRAQAAAAYEHHARDAHEHAAVIRQSMQRFADTATGPASTPEST